MNDFIPILLVALGAILLNRLVGHFMARRGNQRIAALLEQEAAARQGHVSEGNRRSNPRLHFTHGAQAISMSVMSGGRRQAAQTWALLEESAPPALLLRVQSKEVRRVGADADGLATLEVGGAAFKKRFVTLTNDPRLARRLLARPLQRTLKQLDSDYPEGIVVQIENGRTQAALLQFARDPAPVSRLAELACQLAEQLANLPPADGDDGADGDSDDAGDEATAP